VKTQPNQLPSQLKHKLAPCYLVSGEEPLLVGEALDTIREAARSRGFTSRDLHVADRGFDWALLETSSSSLSLFAESRIIELKLPTGKPGRAGSQAIIDLVARCGADLLLVVSAPKLDRGTQSSKWFKAIDAAGVTVQVWPVNPRELPGWIAERMRSAGLEPEREAVRMIAERVEGNLLAASQEIEKLRLLLGPGKVAAEAVRLAVANSSRFDVFKLVDAALGGDARRAMRILLGLRTEGVEPVIVVWALTRELRSLLRIAETMAAGRDLGAAMQQAGVWRSRQGLVRGCIGRHGGRGFGNLLKSVARADRAAKGQLRADPWQLATDVVLGLALGERRAA
jgi:DNA polymerase-3 subunit delta